MHLCLFAAILLSTPLLYHLSFAQTSATFNFGAVGDFDDVKKAKATIKHMASHSPELLIGLGDYRYDDGERNVDEFWNDIVMPNKGNAKWYGALGNHDADNSELYLNKFNQSSWTYSFDSNGTHFLAIDAYADFKKGSDQYSFVQNDLKKASANPNVKWKVVFMHPVMYASCSVHCPENELRDTYQPLFDQYNVDLVLQGHDHNYQRTYPLEFNAANPNSPIIAASDKSNYTDPKGQVYLTVGTGGRHAHNLDSEKPGYLITEFTDTVGHVDISVLDNGTMKGVYYSDDDEIKDQFTIKKGDA